MMSSTMVQAIGQQPLPPMPVAGVGATYATNTNTLGFTPPQDTFQRQRGFSNPQAQQQLQQILATAQQLGFTPEQTQQLQQRLERGLYAVASADAKQSRNLLERDVTNPDEREKLLAQAFSQLQRFPDRASLKLALGTLLQEGQLPDISSQGTLVAYQVSNKNSRTPGTEKVDITQQQYRLEATQGTSQPRAVLDKQQAIQAQAVDALTPDFSFFNPERLAYHGLSRDASDLKKLESTVASNEFVLGVHQVAKLLESTPNPDAKTLEKALTPLKDKIASAYGLKGLKVMVDSSSPDEGASAALYDPTKKALVIFTSGLESKRRRAEAEGHRGKELNLFVAKELATTLAHEGRHAFQYTALENPQAFGLDTPQDKQSLAALKANTQVYNAPTISRLLTGSREWYADNPLEKGVEDFENRTREVLNQRLGFA
ncbi:MAG: hypothetical protein ACKO34_09435 [Vampirovibrionales bacterium]